MSNFGKELVQGVTQNLPSLKGSLSKGNIKFIAGLGTLPIGIEYGQKLTMGSLNFSLSKANRYCGAYNFSPAKKACIAKFKIDHFTKVLKYLNEKRTQCKNDKCLEIIDKKIKWAKVEIIYAKRDLIEYREMIRNLKNPSLEESDINEGLGMTAASTIGGMVVSGALYAMVDPVISKALQKTQELFSQAARKCKIYGSQGALRDMCIAKYKLQALNQRRDLYKKALNDCRGKANKEKCEMKILPKLNQTEAQIKMLNDNIKIYRQGAIEAAKEETKALR